MNLLVVLGPTASGKTHLAVQAALHLSGEIISADSRQVYRGLDIGSGKDLQEYGDVPYHLVDVVDPGDEFSQCPAIVAISKGHIEQEHIWSLLA